MPPAPPHFSAPPQPWVQVASGAPYFVLDNGQPWTPIGQNDAITWPDLGGLFRRRDVGRVAGHLAWLAGHGVTVLRLMLEYCQTEHRYLERPLGRFQPNMVRFWDDLFALCAQHGLRLLLTPYDTFWMQRRWRHHPYSRAQGGPVARPGQWLTHPVMRAAIKQRLTFATKRWGSSGTLFAWDLWNEIHPAHAGGETEAFHEFIEDISQYLRVTELRAHGRAHPQTVSLFGPELYHHPHLGEVIFRHPQLDVASTHFYDAATIDYPRDTLGPARRTGELVREALAQLPPGRPFFDSEHGPIHTFKDRHRTLPAWFDDEYFRHMQWAHLASGGAGGGLRWPNRHPHVLTHGMRAAQRSLADFAQLLDWPQFRRCNLNAEVQLSTPAFAAFACADEQQALVWLLRQDSLTRRGVMRRRILPLPVRLLVPGLRPGPYVAHLWDTPSGQPAGELAAEATEAGLTLHLPAVRADVALAIRPAG